MSLLGRRMMMAIMETEEEEMAEWQLLSEVSLDEAKNVAFELNNIDCKEIYIFANVGITETGNTSIDINDQEAEFFTCIYSVGQCKYSTIHCFMIGNRFLAEEIEDYALTAHLQKKLGIHPKQGISGNNITSIRLFRNATTFTFLEGSTFEIWGR